MDSPTPIKAFVSYAHKDYKLAQHFIDELKDYAAASNTFDWSFWIDTDILASQNWDSTIKKGIEESDIAFLLLSAPFLASKYIKTVEFREFIEKRKASKFPIFPILLKKCPYPNWEELSTIQVFKLKEEPSPVPFKTYINSKEEQKEDFLMGIIEQAELVLERRFKTLLKEAKKNELISEEEYIKNQTKLNQQRQALLKNSERFLADDLVSEWLNHNLHFLNNEYLNYYCENRLAVFAGLDEKKVEILIKDFLGFIHYQFEYSKAISKDEMKNYYQNNNLQLPILYTEDMQGAIEFLKNITKENLHALGVKYLDGAFEKMKEAFSML